MQKLLTFFFSKNISICAIFNDKSLNDTLTNDIVSFEQLGPVLLPVGVYKNAGWVTNSVDLRVTGVSEYLGK